MVFDELVRAGQLTPKPDLLPPSVPMDYDWARVKFILKFYVKLYLFVFSSLGTWFNT